MIGKILKKFAGAHYKKYIKQKQPLIRRINEIEEGLQSISESELQGKTPELMERFKQGRNS